MACGSHPYNIFQMRLSADEGYMELVRHQTGDIRFVIDYPSTPTLHANVDIEQAYMKLAC